LTISVYHNQDIGPNSIVYIFHSGITSEVLYGYEVTDEYANV